MITKVEELAKALTNAQLYHWGTSQTIERYSTDSRTIKSGEAFIALSGENFDGHNFLPGVAERGAAVAIVSRAWFDKEDRSAIGVPLVVVDDPLKAYGEIATNHRKTFDYPVVAIAGSNGKTTTKELVSDVLASTYSVLRTEGNLNNLIGVPATILRMTANHTAAVIEIGTNAPGEIEQLAEILQPTHGVITNVGREHLELLKTIEGVAEEEAALFRFLEASGGVPFVNMSDEQIARVSSGISRKVTYGQGSGVDVEGKAGALDSRGVTKLRIVDHRSAGSPIDVQMKAPGLHTAMNALAAAAIGLTVGVTRENVRKALESYEPQTGHGYARLAVMTAANGATVINDTYNANPDSMLAGLDTLAAMAPAEGGRRIAVLGEMRELGASSKSEHSDIGKKIASMPELAFAFFHGNEMEHAHNATRDGRPTAKSHFVADKKTLIADLSALIQPNDIILVKGSRGMKMEEVVEALLGH